MNNIVVPYGDGVQSACIPEGIKVQVIDPGCRPAKAMVKELIEEAMDHPVGTVRLEEMVREYQGVITIIVNDHTRPGPNAEIMEVLVRRLHAAGAGDDRLQVVVATGSHRASAKEELDMILGKDIRRRLKVYNHDCKDESHVLVGTTSWGLPVWINRRVAESPFIITTGLIVPHHTAGFSGGRKSILPGVAGIDTLRIHHSLPLRPFEPSMGWMEENPFHIAAVEAASMTAVRFMINVVQDSHKQNLACVAGDLVLAHEAGVGICRSHNSIDVHGLADVVIVSPGGSPRDKDLYQAQKALAVGEVFGRKENCTFILCAKADEGIGEGLFRQWLVEANDPQEVIERFRREGFNVGNNKAFMYARALTKGRVIVVSDCLDKDEVEAMMLEWAGSLQEAMDRVCSNGKPQCVAVIPRAVNIIPHVVEEE